MNKKIYDEIATAIQAVVERVRHQCGQNSVGGNAVRRHIVGGTNRT